MFRTMPFEIVGRIDNDRVHARFFREHLRLLRVLLQPHSVRRAAREVDNLHFGTERKLLGHIVALFMRDQRDYVRVETGFRQHLSRRLQP